MNIDLLPFSAFALEACSSGGQAAGQGQTLTLQLEMATVHSSVEPMAGTACTTAPISQGAQLLRAAVVPAGGPVLTITF